MVSQARCLCAVCAWGKCFEHACMHVTNFCGIFFSAQTCQSERVDIVGEELDSVGELSQ